MKSIDVSGVATPAAGSQVGVVVEEGAGSAARTVGTAIAKARSRAIGAIASQRAGARTIDRLVQEVDRKLRSAMLRPPVLRVWIVQAPADHALSVAGYARAPRAASSGRTVGPDGTVRTARASLASGAAGTKGTAGTKGASGSSSSGEWAFLDDPKLSIEDKLFMFMKLVMQKSNDDLERRMKAYRTGKSGTSGSGATSGTSQPKKSSGGVFGLLKKAFPPLAALEKVVPGLPDLLDKAVIQLGPNLLGALMIPLGAPWAAPLVQKAASALLPGALEAVSKAVDGGSEGASGSKASGGAGDASSTGVSKDGDERMQLLEIERMMQKTNQMFSTISNILKSTHDAAMTAVNNIR